MRTLTVFLAIALSTPALAKVGCEEEVDPFTKETTVVAHGGRSLEVKASGDTVTARIVFTIGRAISEPLAPGFTVQLLLEDGTIVDLVADEPTVGGAQATQASVYTMFPVALPLTDAQLQQLAGSRPTHMKYEMFGDESNIALPSGFAKKYHKAFSCVAEHRG